MSAAPPARRRLVGAALRRYRESTGYDLADAARLLGCDRSKVSRIESGERGIRVPELQALLREYGVDATATEALVMLSGPSSIKAWWQEFGGVVPAGMKDFGAIEALASSIMIYDTYRVPDLLQTADYARALIDAGTAPGSDIQAMGSEATGSAATGSGAPPGGHLRMRMLGAVLARQQAVLASRPEITLVIAESALLNQVGGARVTRGQLDSLARVAADSGHITIGVLPLSRGTLVAATGPMTIVGINGVPSLGAVHVPGVHGGICLADASDVTAYTRAFEHLRLYALSPAASARFLSDLAARRLLTAS